MDSIELTVMLDLDGWPAVGALIRCTMEGVAGVRLLAPNDAAVWVLTGVNGADALLRAGLPLDGLDALDPVWRGTTILPVLKQLAQIWADQGEAARDALLLARWPTVASAQDRWWRYTSEIIDDANARLRELARPIFAMRV